MAGILPNQNRGILSLGQRMGRIGQILSTYGRRLDPGAGGRERIALSGQWNQQDRQREYYSRLAGQDERSRLEYARKLEAQRQEQQRLESFVSTLPPGQQQAAMVNPTAFAKPPTAEDPYIKMGTETLLDRNTLKPIWQATQTPKERRVIEGADSYKYYEDTGERVLSGVKKEQPYRTRELSLLGNMVQPQELVNGKWQSTGAPYSRRGAAATGSPLSPTKQDLERVTNLLESDRRFMEVENKKELSFAVASRSREIMKEQKIGSYPATQKALDELSEQITPGEKRTGMFGWDWTKSDVDPQFNYGVNNNQGQTATNPQTGERIIFKGGRWIPAGI